MSVASLFRLSPPFSLSLSLRLSFTSPFSLSGSTPLRLIIHTSESHPLLQRYTGGTDSMAHHFIDLLSPLSQVSTRIFCRFMQASYAPLVYAPLHRIHPFADKSKPASRGYPRSRRCRSGIPPRRFDSALSGIIRFRIARGNQSLFDGSTSPPPNFEPIANTGRFVSSRLFQLFSHPAERENVFYRPNDYSWEYFPFRLVNGLCI